MLYSVVLVSAIHQHESAARKHTSPPSRTSLPPPTPALLGFLEHRFRHPASYRKFPLAAHFTDDNVYVSTPLSQFIPLSPSPTVSTGLHLHCCPANRFISTILKKDPF